MTAKQKARQIAQEVRYRQNAEKVMECQNSGLSIAEWCRREGISNNTFYRWRRRAREQAVEAMETKSTLVVQESGSPAPVQSRFVELPALELRPKEIQPPDKDTAIRIQLGGSVIEIQKKTDARLAESVVRALSNLC
jgi:transposase-like protein